MAVNDLFRKHNCLGSTKKPLDANDPEIPHNIVFTPVRHQTRKHPTEEDCMEETIIEGIMYCTKCGLITEETIDFGDK